MPPDLDQDHRLDARGSTDAAHETARIAYAFDIKQNALGFGVRNQVIENLAEINIERRTKGNDTGKTDIVGLRPIQNRRAERPGLRDEGQIADIRTTLVESSIKADIRSHDPQTIRPDQPHTIMLRGFQHLSFQYFTGFTGLTEAGGDDDGRPDLMLAALLDDIGDGRRRRRNHRQFDGLLNLRQRGTGFDSLNFLVLGINGIKRTLIATLQHILEHDLPDRICTITGTKHRYGFWREKRLEMVLAHGCWLP